jgi:hypothetical protein
MGRRQDKLIRKTVRRVAGSQFPALLAAMLDAPLATRLRYAAIIIFRLGRRDIEEGGAHDHRQPA